MKKNNKSTSTQQKSATRVVHTGRDPDAQNGFVNPPAYRGSTVVFPTLARLQSRAQPYTYGRRGTPTTDALEQAICDLERGAGTILVSSGLQAVSTTLLAFVEAGDEILMTDSVYQPTRVFCDGLLKRLGVSTRYYDPTLGAGIEALITPKTRLVFTESPGSQTFEMQDIPAVSKVAHAHDLWHIMDNTWASPLFFQPLEHGVDVSIQAATKYIVGHADAMLGAITGNTRAYPYLNKAKEGLGTSPGSEETYLGLRGLRTMSVRLRQHHTSGLDIAHWLSERPEVQTVMHPGLPSDPGHALWKRDYSGASGLFGFRLKPAPQAALAAFVDDLAFFDMGYSWGGYESLILPCNPCTSRTATTWHEPDTGFTIRLHIGLEDVDDLKADLAAGLERFNAASKT
ncbi:MAG: cystathionine beta-lyase [Pseudomonadota bacterium]